MVGIGGYGEEQFRRRDLSEDSGIMRFLQIAKGLHLITHPVVRYI